MRIIISGGGTGGHIYPALSIASGLKESNPNCEILFVGTKEGMESTIIPREGYPFKTIDIEGINRKSLIKAGKTLAAFPRSLFQARQIIKEFQPEIIIGTGGYVSYPIVLAGTLFGQKTVIHEQNVLPGMANRNLAKRVDYVLLSFEESKEYIKAKNIMITGLPVRKEIIEAAKLNNKTKVYSTKDVFTLLVFGGSRGAARINQAMLELIPKYLDIKINIIWITGEEEHKKLEQEVKKTINEKTIKCEIKLLPYSYNIEESMRLANLAVCRAGASTLAELAIMGLPAILVPYPYAAEGHQEKNARALLRKKAARMIIDEFIDGDTLYKEIEQLREDKDALISISKNIKKEAKVDAIDKIVELILSLK